MPAGKMYGPGFLKKMCGGYADRITRLSLPSPKGSPATVLKEDNKFIMWYSLTQARMGEV
jgi:hypothetical protein